MFLRTRATARTFLRFELRLVIFSLLGATGSTCLTVRSNPGTDEPYLIKARKTHSSLAAFGALELGAPCPLSIEPGAPTHWDRIFEMARVRSTCFREAVVDGGRSPPTQVGCHGGGDAKFIRGGATFY